jgi:CDP-glucose 4,6-dehydratase
VDIVHALAAGKSVPLRNPTAVRPWQHVLDALHGYLTLAARLLNANQPEDCRGWNFGPLPGNELPVREMAELFLRYWPGGRLVDASDSSQPHEAHILRLSIDQAMWRLGWKPRWDVAQAVAATARWYQAYFGGSCDMAALAQQQIAEFEGAAGNTAGEIGPAVPVGLKPGFEVAYTTNLPTP